MNFCDSSQVYLAAGGRDLGRNIEGLHRYAPAVCKMRKAPLKERAPKCC